MFQTIRESLAPGNVHELFEPSRYVEPLDPQVDNVLAKVILGVESGVDYEEFLAFGKAVYIVRDPRDWLVSNMIL